MWTTADGGSDPYETEQRRPGWVWSPTPPLPWLTRNHIIALVVVLGMAGIMVEVTLYEARASVLATLSGLILSSLGLWAETQRHNNDKER